jgi:dolichol-phosphate mannosyltransferase
MGYKQVPCYYEREERFAGETKYPFKKMIKFAMIGVFYFSKKPLQIATFSGFISVAIGIIYGLIALITKLINPDALVTGWTTLIILIIFFGGVHYLP